MSYVMSCYAHWHSFQTQASRNLHAGRSLALTKNGNPVVYIGTMAVRLLGNPECVFSRITPCAAVHEEPCSSAQRRYGFTRPPRRPHWWWPLVVGMY